MLKSDLMKQNEFKNNWTNYTPTMLWRTYFFFNFIKFIGFVTVVGWYSYTRIVKMIAGASY